MKLRTIIKQVVGAHNIMRLRGFWSRITGFFSRLTFKSKILTRLRYGFFSNSFVDEQCAVSAGQALYWSTEPESSAKSIPELRRNIHRLEKGLIMNPRRPVFAADYIMRTVSLYQAACLRLKEPTQELFWARDVLKIYFSTTEKTDNIAAAENVFRTVKLGTDDSQQRTPFKRQLSNTITFDDLLGLAIQRRSVRWFLNRPVPRTMIDQALEVATQSPSACNRQSFYFRILDDAELIQKAAAIPGGAEGFRHNFPTYAIVIGRLRAYPEPHDRHAIYVDGSLSTMSFVYALETLGLASCLINWGDHPVKNARISKLLGLAPDERVITTLAIGFPDLEASVPYSQKKEVSLLRAYNSDDYRG